MIAKNLGDRQMGGSEGLATTERTGRKRWDEMNYPNGNGQKSAFKNTFLSRVDEPDAEGHEEAGNGRLGYGDS